MRDFIFHVPNLDKIQKNRYSIDIHLHIIAVFYVNSMKLIYVPLLIVVQSVAFVMECALKLS